MVAALISRMVSVISHKCKR